MAGKRCNKCGRTYDRNASLCPEDGEPLVAADAMIGQTIDGRYRIESILGRGGMGVVYRATHIHIDARCAVKVLNHELVANQAAIERFRREAKAAGRIDHPNAIRVTDFGVTTENVVYLVMELVEGKTLNELLYSEGPLDFRRAVNLMAQVCAAVDAAHRNGVIHRDLKPDNIIINRTGLIEGAKVGDFGIAKLRERTPTVDTDADTLSGESQGSIYRTITEAGTIIGTPQYMSPEQCRAKELDQRSDVYSLGIIFYEMICGQGPFSGGAPVEVLMKQVGETPRLPREFVANVPRTLETSVMRALEKDPANRQSSAAEFIADLERALEMEAESHSPGVSRPTIHQRKPETLKTETEFERDSGASASRPTNVMQPGRPSQPTSVLAPARKKSWAIPIGLVLLAALIAAVVYGLKGSKTMVVDEMVLIPGGAFQMGRENGEPDERPVHEERIKDFYLDKYEVTNEQYKKFIDQASYRPPSNWNQNTYPAGEAKLPVTYVSWFDAVQYAKWAGKRLPTEAEWEYAARNGSKQTLYPWGNQWRPNYTAVGILNLNKPFPVGRFENDKNEYGVYDLAGNVCEWVADNYHIYGSSTVYEVKVFRGGSFAEIDTPAEKLTGTYRWYVPADPEEKLKPKIGFRCAKDK